MWEEILIGVIVGIIVSIIAILFQSIYDKFKLKRANIQEIKCPVCKKKGLYVLENDVKACCFCGNMFPEHK